MAARVINQGRGPFGQSTLKLTTPHMRGTDVGHAQARLDDWIDHWKLPLSKVSRDKDFGPDTRGLGRAFEYYEGFPDRLVNGILDPKYSLPVLNDSHYAVAPVAGIVTRYWVRRGAKRRNYLRAHRSHGREGVMEFARKNLEVVEHPPNSNSGPGISTWERLSGMGAGPWCGAFVIAAYQLGGGIRLPHSWVYTPDIYYDAGAGRNGARAVPMSAALPGDLVLFSFGSHPCQHVGLVEKRISGGLQTIEGNTSPGISGSQDNGGGVHRKLRYSGIVRIVRIG